MANSSGIQMKNIVNVTFTRIRHHRARHPFHLFWLIDSKLSARTTKNYWTLLLYAIVIFHLRMWTEGRWCGVYVCGAVWLCGTHYDVVASKRVLWKGLSKCQNRRSHANGIFGCQQTHTLSHNVYDLRWVLVLAVDGHKRQGKQNSKKTNNEMKYRK